MNKVTLIQRLKLPRRASNAFAFGGGLVNGGLSDQAVEIFKDIWDFDYMGAAEFEFGSVPKALQKIADYSSAGKACTNSIQLAKDVPYICQQGLEIDIEAIICKLAEDERQLLLKEPCFLRETLDGKEYCKNFGGWLELDNGFMFFANETMYRKTLNLFEIPYIAKGGRK